MRTRKDCSKGEGRRQKAEGRRLEAETELGRRVPAGLFEGRSWLTITPPTPLFFVSAESKGLSDPVSSLDATLMGDFISVDSK